MSSKKHFSLRRRFCFSWHPAPVGSTDTVGVALIASARISGLTWRSFVSVLLWAPTSSTVAHGQPMVLSEARVWARHYGFVGLSEGSIRWPMRLFRLSRPGYLPSNPCAQLSNLRTSAFTASGLGWWCALMLLVTSDVPLRTSLLSSTESGQSPPSCGPASVVPWRAAYRSPHELHRTRGTDPPSHSPSSRHS